MVTGTKVVLNKLQQRVERVEQTFTKKYVLCNFSHKILEQLVLTNNKNLLQLKWSGRKLRKNRDCNIFHNDKISDKNLLMANQFRMGQPCQCVVFNEKIFLKLQNKRRP